MKVCLVSLGCEKNLVDSENILGVLVHKRGYEITPDIEEADIAVVNTCAFINDAKDESIEAIVDVGRYKEEGKLKKLIVAGCLGQRYADDLMKEMPEIDAIIGTGEIEKIGEIIDETIEDERVVKTGNIDYIYSSKTERVLTTFPHTTYIKIAEGCDKYCTYCIIPKLRGKFRSRKIEDIVEEAKGLVESGIKEINIIAQDTIEYGIDIYGKRELPKLLKELAKVEDLKWIRVFYTYPDDYSDELIQVIKEEKKICNYIDVPIQHASDRILKRMNRKEKFEGIKTTLNKIRKEIPDAAFRTSVIVGFPGETDEEFNEVKSFIKNFEFDFVGVFKYSQEEGTPAAEMDDQIDEDVKEARWAELMNLQNEIIERKNKSFIGKELEVMIDGVAEESEFMLEGRTQGQGFGIDGKVLINDGTGNRGDIVKVKIEQNFEYDLLGGIID